jgi:hypothetical protein
MDRKGGCSQYAAAQESAPPALKRMASRLMAGRERPPALNAFIETQLYKPEYPVFV